MLASLFYYTPQYEISPVCFVCFFMSFICVNIIKHFSVMGFWEDCQYLRWHVCSKVATFQHHVPHTDLVNAHVNFYRTVYFPRVKWHSGKLLLYSYEFIKCMRCVILLIMWLCCGAETPGGEVFVRSFVSHYPEGFSAPYFFCSESPGYTSVISLLPSPPSRLKDTVGID